MMKGQHNFERFPVWHGSWFMWDCLCSKELPEFWVIGTWGNLPSDPVIGNCDCCESYPGISRVFVIKAGFPEHSTWFYQLSVVCWSQRRRKRQWSGTWVIRTHRFGCWFFEAPVFSHSKSIKHLDLVRGFSSHVWASRGQKMCSSPSSHICRQKCPTRSVASFEGERPCDKTWAPAEKLRPHLTAFLLQR